MTTRDNMQHDTMQKHAPRPLKASIKNGAQTSRPQQTDIIDALEKCGMIILQATKRANPKQQCPLCKSQQARACKPDRANVLHVCMSLQKL
jgi:hypothetical protein